MMILTDLIWILCVCAAAAAASVQLYHSDMNNDANEEQNEKRKNDSAL